MIRTLIADDHQLFADSLATGIRAIADLDVVATAADGVAALDVLRSNDVDVVIMDLEMPNMDGLSVLTSAESIPATIVVTMHATADREAAAFAAGARAFLPKSTPLTDLAAAIRAVHGGITLDDPTTQREILDRHQLIRLTAEAESLTSRERELLQTLATGITTTPDLAETLFISEKTVKNHLASIYEKLAVSDRAQAVLEAIRLGVV